MKKILLIFTLLLGFLANVPAIAQERGNRGNGERQYPSFEQFMAEKIHFLVQEMKLNATDSAQFITVYQELQREKGQLMAKYRGTRDIVRKIRNGETVADSLYIKVVNIDAQVQAEDAQLELKYIEKFAKVLTPKQLFDYRQAEKKFKNNFMQRHPNRDDNHARRRPSIHEPKMTPPIKM
ncbi:MAG: hypothetical protein J6W69_07865 [Bacteroidales bacterium]|nr:hypothetical protein [Bacteroidales bacterium]